MHLTLDKDILDVGPGGGQAPHSLPWRSSIRFIEEVGEDIQWLIPGVLPIGAIVLLSGRPGDMKTWAALSMARAVASGEPWLGRPTTQGPVLYLDGEMSPAVLGNYLRWAKPVEPLYVANWTDLEFPNGLGSEQLRQAARLYRLLVVDTLRRQMGDLKENSSDDMAKVTKDLRELTRYGATVLVLHHVPKNPENKGPRGAIELLAGCDKSILVTKQSKKGSQLVLEMQKTRYPASTDLVIQVARGELGPLFTVQGDQSGDLGGTTDLDELDLVINQLRQELGHDPNKTEVRDAARHAGLGGRHAIERLLAKGNGVHWVQRSSGKSTVVCPPIERPDRHGEPGSLDAVNDADASLLRE